jgi:hypothetical protein
MLEDERKTRKIILFEDLLVQKKLYAKRKGEIKQKSFCFENQNESFNFSQISRPDGGWQKLQCIRGCRKCSHGSCFRWSTCVVWILAWLELPVGIRRRVALRWGCPTWSTSRRPTCKCLTGPCSAGTRLICCLFREGQSEDLMVLDRRQQLLQLRRHVVNAPFWWRKVVMTSGKWSTDICRTISALAKCRERQNLLEPIHRHWEEPHGNSSCCAHQERWRRGFQHRQCIWKFKVESLNTKSFLQLTWNNDRFRRIQQRDAEVSSLKWSNCWDRCFVRLYRFWRWFRRLWEGNVWSVAPKYWRFQHRGPTKFRWDRGKCQQPTAVIDSFLLPGDSSRAMEWRLSCTGRGAWIFYRGWMELLAWGEAAWQTLRLCGFAHGSW